MVNGFGAYNQALHIPSGSLLFGESSVLVTVDLKLINADSPEAGSDRQTPNRVILEALLSCFMVRRAEALPGGILPESIKNRIRAR